MAALLLEERRMMAANIRAFLADAAGDAAVMRLVDTPSEVDLLAWREMVEKLGVGGMLVTEACGGLDLDLADALLAVEEAARALYRGPLLSSAVLAPMALRLSDDADGAAPYLAALAAGTQVTALAMDDVAGRSVRARALADGWSLRGEKTAVLDGGHADLLLVTALDDAGSVGLFVVQADDTAVDLRALDVFDKTRRQAAAVFDGAPARRIGGDFKAGAALLADIAATAAVAEQVGIAQRSLDIAVEHAKIREQFGRPIGSFQAVKHLCADMLARVECMRAAMRAAASAIAGEDERQRAETVSVAKAFGSEGAIFVTETAIQVLGGIGCTWEHPAHLYLRRAWSLAAAFGDAAHHRRRIASLAGLDAA